MKSKIKQIIFTDKKQDWTPLKRNGVWFFMLHLQLEDWKWISKFYNKSESNPTSKIEVNKEYEIVLKQNWEYYNLISLSDLNWNIIIS